MNNTGVRIQSIIRLLSEIEVQVELYNSLNLTDYNIHAEQFFCTLLNKIYGYNLRSRNTIDQNAIAIDLDDPVARISIQVTSDPHLTKKKKTVEKFIKAKLYEKYDTLKILNIGKMSKHKRKNLGNSVFSFDTIDDVMTRKTLISDINSLSPTKIENIEKFLASEIRYTRQNTIEKNVETIVELIEMISNEEHSDTGKGFLERPLPERKYRLRFADHADFLMDSYTDLVIEYGEVLKAVEAGTDFGPVTLNRVEQHLRIFSDEILLECDGNPVKALAKLRKHFIEKLGQLGKRADTGAVQFFLLSHLNKCNVFPNPRAVDQNAIS